MNHRDDLDRELSTWLDDAFLPPSPRNYREVVERTRHMRQRPAWASLERWLPMTVITRPALAPPLPVVWFLIVGLLAVALAGGAALLLGAGAQPAQATNGLIAFQHLGDIYTVRPDGSDRRVLVEAPGVQTGASWSPDGTRLAYWSGVAGIVGWQLVVVDADGSDPVVVASDVLEVTGWEHPDWSPDGSSLAFSARTARAGQGPCAGGPGVEGDFCSSRIFVAAADGSTGAVQTGDPALDARTAAWSPGGSAIAFSGGDAGEGIGLYVMTTDGTDIRRLDEVSGTGWTFIRLDWSPDGASIVATAGDVRWDVWVFAADGNAETMVSEVPAEGAIDQFFPTYGPDGALAWKGGSAASEGIVLLEQGGVPVTLPGFGGWPEFSPDGQLIATSSGDTPNIAITDRKGANLTTIAALQTGEFGAGPSWQSRPG